MSMSGSCTSPRSRRSVQVDDCLMENIDAALSDRESGALANTALWDDLHVARGKAEHFEAKLRRQAIEEEVGERK